MKFSARLSFPVKLVALGALVASLAGCGGGGGDDSSSGGGDPALAFIATAADNLFPLDANTRRVYTSTASTGTYTDRITGTQVVAGGTGTVVRTVDSTDGSEDLSIYVVGSSGVRVYAAASADALDRAFDGVELMRWPMRAGERHLQIDKTFDSGEDFDGDGRSDTIVVRSEVTAVARESVSTGAGMFPDSLHLQQIARVTVQPSRGGPSVSLDFSIDEWYAPNVGLVKRTALTSTIGGVPNTRTDTLVAYRVGTRTSDSAAPTVASVAPDAAVVRGSATSISAQFNKAMDPASFTAPGSFTVVDNGGTAIAGTVQVEGQTVRFVATQSWASGSYTANISTAAQDLLGNALAAPRSWTFTVDATAPGLVSVTPASEAVDVGTAGNVVLTFSEPPDPATINANNIVLTVTGSGSVVPIQLSVEGSRVTVTPTAALERNQYYAIAVRDITDAVGNPLAQAYSSRFLTAQGRFAFHQSLFSSWSVHAMATGDVNGDGIPDVLAAGQTNLVVSEQGLVLRSGRPDGTLDAEVRLDIGPLSGCRVGPMAIGDVNGDGRPDVVVVAGFCGTLVLAQTPGGNLVPAQHLDSAYGDILRLADVDGDGRLDLVIGRAFGNKIEVWRQGNDGLLSLSSNIDLGSLSLKSLEVGDVNGDGRADLVAAVSGFLEQHMAVLRQEAGGSFAAPQILSTESPWGAAQVALGDLNGDGRVDIVATTGGNSSAYLAVFYQAADGAIGPLTRLASHDIPYAVRVADINGDGRADIVVSHEGWSAVGVYLQQAGGTLAAEERFRAPAHSNGAGSVVVGDINRDGLPDILIAGSWLRQIQSTGASSQLTGPAALDLRLQGGLLRH